MTALNPKKPTRRPARPGRDRTPDRVRLGAVLGRWGLALLLVLLAAPLAPTSVPAEEAPAAPSRTPDDVEMLRRLLGVEPEPAPPAEVPAAQPAESPSEATEPAKETTPPVEPKPVPAPPAAKKPEPKPAPAAEPVGRPTPVAPAPEPAPPAETALPGDEGDDAEGQATNASDTPRAPFDVEVPEAGTVVTAADIPRWRHLLSPAIEWALQRGARIKVGAYETLGIEPARVAATERYSAQVRLSDDKNELVDYVAGIPFPDIDVRDPDVAVKLIFNFSWRISVDDLDIRNFSCQTGSISATDGLVIERDYLNAHFHRLYYRGRLFVDPKPVWDNGDGINYREALHPIVEPFDLKGAGFSYNRYVDPNRQDDSWLYFPQFKRVRRLSTAQRSEGIFGQDIDLDSYGGFAGQPAWSDWKFLGTKTVLAPMNVRELPVAWQDKPADFIVGAVWQPRNVYVIEGRSRLPGYTFGKRVLYIDQETFFIPYTESYDLKGQLWKGFVQTLHFSKEAIPGIVSSGDGAPTFILPAFSMFDMQFDHATRCNVPAPNPVGSSGWFFNYGEAEGTTESVFDVSTFISEGR